jgi:hypothetical protein
MKNNTLRLVRQRLPIPTDAIRALTPVLLRWAYSAPLVAYFIYCALLSCQLLGWLPNQWPVTYALLAGDGVSLCFFVAALAYIRVLGCSNDIFFFQSGICHGLSCSRQPYVAELFKFGVPRLGDENPSALELVSMYADFKFFLCGGFCFISVILFMYCHASLLGSIYQLVLLGFLFGFHLSLQAEGLRHIFRSWQLVTVFAMIILYVVLIRDWTWEVLFGLFAVVATYVFAVFRLAGWLNVSWVVVFLPWFVTATLALLNLFWLMRMHWRSWSALQHGCAICMCGVLLCFMITPALWCYRAEWDSSFLLLWIFLPLHVGHALCLFLLVCYLAGLVRIPRCSDDLYKISALTTVSLTAESSVALGLPYEKINSSDNI